jgi:hypothetical protein
MDAKNNQTSTGGVWGADSSLINLPVTNGAEKRSLYSIKIEPKVKKPNLYAP